MTRKPSSVSCPNCGERYRAKALRCSACGITNPLYGPADDRRPSLEDRIGLPGMFALVAVAGVILVAMVIWLVYDVATVSSVDPYLGAVFGMVILLGFGALIVRAMRRGRRK